MYIILITNTYIYTYRNGIGNKCHTVSIRIIISWWFNSDLLRPQEELGSAPGNIHRHQRAGGTWYVHRYEWKAQGIAGARGSSAQIPLKTNRGLVNELSCGEKKPSQESLF